MGMLYCVIVQYVLIKLTQVIKKELIWSYESEDWVNVFVC